MDLRCPHCGEPLTQGERVWVCPRGHSFDRARQGYVNLLRQTRAHGDSAAMLRARRRFLDAGWYAPLAEAVAETVGAWMRGAGERMPREARALVDCGCGEGYYLSYLAGALESELSAGDWRLYGFDLARDAVLVAAGRRYSSPGAALFVANMWDRLPFADACVGVALVIFAPRNPAELARVVAPGGLLLVVTPTSEHLAEARAALPWLLTPEPEKSARLQAALSPAFELTRQRAVTFPLALDGDALADMAEMTPHRKVVEEALREAAHAAAAKTQSGRLEVTAACVISSLTRTD